MTASAAQGRRRRERLTGHRGRIVAASMATTLGVLRYERPRQRLVRSYISELLRRHDIGAGVRVRPGLYGCRCDARSRIPISGACDAAWRACRRGSASSSCR